MRQAIRVGGITFMTGIACAAVATIMPPWGASSVVVAMIGGFLAFMAAEDVK